MSMTQLESFQTEVDKMALQGAPPTEFLCGFPAFQNGGNSHVKRTFIKGIQGEAGLKRRILHCSNLERGIKSSLGSSGRKLCEICLSVIRAGQCLQNIHQNHKTCSGNSSEFRDSSSNIPRRPSLPRRLRTDCSFLSENRLKSPRNLGFCNQPKKVSAIPSSENRLSRYARDKVRSISRV